MFKYVNDETKERPHDAAKNEVPIREEKKEISMKEFQREYKKLKRIQNSIKFKYRNPDKNKI